MVGRPRRARPALDLDLLWRAYIRRFDIEHTVRFAKQTLGWTTPRPRHPQQAERWTWLVLAGYTQLRLARQIACDRRLPWERPRPSPPVTRAGPQRVSATSRRARLASRHTETRGQLPRPTQRQQPRASPPLPSHQGNQQSRQSRLTGSHNQPNQSPASSATIPSTPTGLNHKLRTPNEMIFEVVGSLRD
jgi:hypothetical protein